MTPVAATEICASATINVYTNAENIKPLHKLLVVLTYFPITFRRKFSVFQKVQGIFIK